MIASERARRIRNTLTDIVRQRPGSPSLRATAWLEPRACWPDWTPVLAGIPWAIADAVATRTYMPERERTISTS